ncbi:MAG: CinA family protein [Geodermatophilaceae bacterium]|nr:CinA family protein [Geodermatophilaceae bacterium]
MPADPSEIHRQLRQRGLTVAVAESLTGGLLSAALTTSPGSSGSFRGGLVVYATELKAMLAGVPQPLLDAQGAVSAAVAVALARGVRENLGADLGVGITGVAGPESVGEHRAGTVFLAVAGADFHEVSRADLAGSRAEIRARSVDAALDLLLGVLLAAHELGMPEAP